MEAVVVLVVGRCDCGMGDSEIARDGGCANRPTGFMAIKGRDEHWRQRHETTANLELNPLSKTKERWILMQEGKLFLRTENADWNFARRGAEADEREITREEVARNHPEILSEVDEILAGQKKETRIF